MATKLSPYIALSIFFLIFIKDKGSSTGAFVNSLCFYKLLTALIMASTVMPKC